MKTSIEMAREADPKANLSEPYCLDHETRAWLERFAELVRADERDECACLCDALERTKVYGAKECAEGIRARGQA